MVKSKICLCLTGKTLDEDIRYVNKYRDFIDLVELRADCLTEDQQLKIREFPQMIDVPAILTVRRKSDGGNFSAGEGSRAVIMAKGLAYANLDKTKNFAYIDLEDDFNVPSIEEAARAFGIRIIRSFHNITGPVQHIEFKIQGMSRFNDEIYKIAFKPNSLSDVSRLFKEAEKLEKKDVILIAMGSFGFATRVLSGKLNSFITFTSPSHESGALQAAPGQIDPETLCKLYNFRNINEDTKIFAVTGFPLAATKSPLIHNKGYQLAGINCVYLPVPAARPEEILDFSSALGIRGLSVTVPHKETIMPFLDDISPSAIKIGSCNTIFRKNGKLYGTNTDADGFSKALLDFLGRKNLKGMKISIIGAGGAAKAVAYGVHALRGKACIFNRSLEKAKKLASAYGFKFASLDISSSNLLSKYSDLIIQTTPIGMLPEPDKDPIPFYSFKGHEILYDIIYEPSETKVMKRARDAGCRVSNGFSMLVHQGALQFEFFTGMQYPIDNGLLEKITKEK